MSIASQATFAPTIREQLKTALRYELGTFENGDTAIWIVPPDAPQIGSGLHVYIDRMSNRVTDLMFTHTLNIAQYDKSPNGCTAFEQACLKIRLQYPNCTERILPYRKQLALEASFTIPVYRYATGNQALAFASL